jgi:hypothetical protein
MKKTKKQIDAWLKVKLKNYLYMLDKENVFGNRDRLFDIYSELTDLIYD